jgi:hypothetical protein
MNVQSQQQRQNGAAKEVVEQLSERQLFHTIKTSYELRASSYEPPDSSSKLAARSLIPPKGYVRLDSRFDHHGGRRQAQAP